MNIGLGAGICRAVRIAAIGMLASLFAVALAGCSNGPADEPIGPPPNPLLYEIASADGVVEGWMVGTIHSLPDGTNWRTPAIEAAADDADLLIVEIAALDDGAKLAATFAQAARTPGLPRLDRRIPARLAPALADLMDRGDLNPDQFAAMETWAAAITLAQIDAEGDPANGVDRALIREFAARPVRELEGARAQFAIFDRLSETAQRGLLAAVVTGAGGAKAQAAKLRRAWLIGDEKVLETATRSGILADPALRDALLVQRNRDWTAAIVPLLQGKPKPLIAVGAAHLVGTEGLASALQAQGYRVRRLT